MTLQARWNFRLGSVKCYFSSSRLKKDKMAADAAKLLDELMGRDRNANPSEARREVRWEDHDVSP